MGLIGFWSRVLGLRARVLGAPNRPKVDAICRFEAKTGNFLSAWIVPQDSKGVESIAGWWLIGNAAMTLNQSDVGVGFRGLSYIVYLQSLIAEHQS